KSTLLRLIGLLQRPDQGTVSLFGITAQPKNSLPLRRRVATVFQDPLLLNESVYENAALGLRLRGIAKREIERRITPWLERFGIAHLSRRAARSLSGGEAQRTNLARAFALEPELLLLDEPFSALDSVSRELLLRDFQSIVRATRTSAVLVTHDRQEGFTLGDRIGVIKAGRLLQLGSRDEVFFRPATESVAAIVGLENRIHGVVQRLDGEFSVIALTGIELYAKGCFNAGTRVAVCIRPDEIFLRPRLCHGQGRNQWTGKIIDIAAGIDGHRIVLAHETCRLVALIKRQEFPLLGFSMGDEVGFGVDPAAVHVIAAEKTRPDVD
ncbi:MAG TPA: ABC transporter ATP-binding protein, partial [Candidatus Binatus sp.]|nr:ABC transporter ATP-binding protein [Candidatus Binatus sp.]